MTAVEQLIDQLTSIGVLEIPQGSNAITYIIENAKEMEKQQIKTAFHKNSQKFFCEKEAEQYYNETFKSE